MRLRTLRPICYFFTAHFSRFRVLRALNCKLSTRLRQADNIMYAYVVLYIVVLIFVFYEFTVEETENRRGRFPVLKKAKKMWKQIVDDVRANPIYLTSRMNGSRRFTFKIMNHVGLVSLIFCWCIWTTTCYGGQVRDTINIFFTGGLHGVWYRATLCGG